MRVRGEQPQPSRLSYLCYWMYQLACVGTWAAGGRRQAALAEGLSSQPARPGSYSAQKEQDFHVDAAAQPLLGEREITWLIAKEPADEVTQWCLLPKWLRLPVEIDASC
jgi:hypothetical protein